VYDKASLDDIPDRIKNLIPPEYEDIGNSLANTTSTYTKFVSIQLEKHIGECGPMFDAVNATTNLFCYKIAAPIQGFWFCMAFLHLLFIIIIITVFTTDWMNNRNAAKSNYYA